MTIIRHDLGKAGISAAIFAAGLLLTVSGASAQQRGGLLDNLFSRGDSQSEQNAKSEASEMAVRIDQLQNQVRQLTGQIEQLQYRNQQLEQQLARQGGNLPPAAASTGAPMAPPPGAVAAAPPQMPVSAAPASALPPAVATSGRRSDAFDPSQNPNAPGVPRALGGSAAVIPAAPVQSDVPVGAAGGAAPGAPLDLSSMAGGAAGAPVAVAPQPLPADGQQLPAPPPRNPSATGTQLATLPPSKSPRDEYDLAYGYVQHKDYALAEQAFRDFLRKYGNDKLVPDANYWLGESLFLRQRYQDAADSYLVVVRNYERSEKAPEALLRLGQSLAALGQKEMACASLGEVGRKYPQAAPSVKRSVTAEQKKAHC